MALTRRNTIVGLGALAAGAGVIGGTGAFTAVEAEREVNLQAAGDSGALIAMAVISDTLNGQGENDDVISINVDNLNLRAVTRFQPALVVGNNGDNTVEIDILATGGTTSILDAGHVIDFSVHSEDDDALASDLDGALSVVDNADALGSGEAVVFDLAVDFRDPTPVDDGFEGFPVESTTDAEAALNDILSGDGDGSIIVEATAVDN